jgi:DNA-binding transcriptional ArsR family regulator
MTLTVDPEHDDAGAVFAALADPTRRRIVRELSADGPLTATQLAARIGISRQATAKHLLALADAGLASAERHGRETRFELDTRPFAEAEAWMRAIGALWDLRLQGLKEFLEGEA